MKKNILKNVSSIFRWKSHGEGKIDKNKFASYGKNVVIESTVLAFHPESIYLSDFVYIGHYSILNGYYRNKMTIDQNTWIGEMCYFHSAGGIEIGKNVGIGPSVKILTSAHDIDNLHPITQNKLEFKKVTIEDDCDIGIGTIILPGVTIKKGTQIGAGSVVTRDTAPFSIVTGVPAKIIRYRK